MIPMWHDIIDCSVLLIGGTAAWLCLVIAYMVATCDPHEYERNRKLALLRKRQKLKGENT